MRANGLLKLDGNCSDAKILIEKISEVQSTAVAKQSGFDIEKFSEEIKRDKKAKRYKKATAKVEAALKDVKLSAEDENLLRIIKAELAASQGDIELARLNYNECKKDSNYFRLLAGRAALLAAESQWQNAEALFKQPL